MIKIYLIFNFNKNDLKPPQRYPPTNPSRSNANNNNHNPPIIYLINDQ